MLYVGIDPGAKGGVAVVDERGFLIELIAFEDVDSMASHMVRLAKKDKLVFAIEKVWTGRTPSVAGKLVGSMMMYIGMASVASIEFHNEFRMLNPAPQTWQSAMECRGLDKKGIHKKLIETYGCSMHLKVPQYLADAAYLAFYAIRQDAPQLQHQKK